MDDVKKETKVDDATAIPQVSEKKGLESWTPEQLKGLYTKSPELFEKAGIVQPKEPVKPKGGESGQPKVEDLAEEIKLTLPEGVPVDEASLKKLTAIMGNKKLSSTQKAQSIIDLQAEQFKALVKETQDRDAKYETTLKGDPDFGKDYEANMEYAKQGLSGFDKDGAVQKRLVEIGAHKDPVLTRYFRNVGKANSEVKTPRSPTAPTKEAEMLEDQHRQRYPNSPQMFPQKSGS